MPTAKSDESLTVYLAGAIEYAPDEGRQWRDEMTEFINTELKLGVFDPAHRERALLSPDEKLNFRLWKSTDLPRFLPVMRRLIDTDLNQVMTRTAFIVVLWDRYSMRGTGTAGELTLAYYHNIPVYMVLDVPPEETSCWVIGCATQVFRTFDELKEFMIREKDSLIVTK